MLSLKSGGFDTVVPVFELRNAMPVNDESFRKEMSNRKWKWKQEVIPTSDGSEPRVSYSFRYQSQENSTINAFLTWGGTRLSVQFSVPRLIDDSFINLSLASPSQAMYWTFQMQDMFTEILPEFPDLDLLKFSRLDTAADVIAGDSRPALIARSVDFYIRGARKPKRELFPHTGASVRSSTQNFKAYDKAKQIEDNLSIKDRQRYESQIREYSTDGVVRLENRDSNKKGLTIDSLAFGLPSFADRLEQGYSGSKVFIGGLDVIQQKLWAMDISSRLKTSMHSFAALYAQYGHEGILDIMPRSTFFYRRKQFLNLGLSLSNLCNSCELDFSSVFEELRNANCETF